MKLIKSLLALSVALSASVSVLADTNPLNTVKDSSKQLATEQTNSAKSAVTEKIGTGKQAATNQVTSAKNSAANQITSTKQPATDKVTASKQSVTDKVTATKEKATAAASKPVNVNINTASAKELQQLTGIGATKAKAIVAYRKKNGNFTNVEQLKQVSGIGDSIVETNKSRIILK